jgi:hypothetical protein
MNKRTGIIIKKEQLAPLYGIGLTIIVVTIKGIIALQIDLP